MSENFAFRLSEKVHSEAENVWKITMTLTKTCILHTTVYATELITKKVKFQPALDNTSYYVLLSFRGWKEIYRKKTITVSLLITSLTERQIMRKRLNKNACFWLLASLLCMVVIFVFSSFPAEQSSGMSNPFVETFLSLMAKWFRIGFTEAAVESLHRLIRKAAHLFIFLTLGICTANTVRHFNKNKKKLNFWVPLLWCSLYAAADELHQYFVPGRSCMWQDWLLDTAGALLGIGIVFLYLRFRNRKISNTANWSSLCNFMLTSRLYSSTCKTKCNALLWWGEHFFVN